MAAAIETPPDEFGSEVEAMVAGIAQAEHLVISTIERECEALRTGRHLAACALRTRLADAARFYLNATRAARASVAILESVQPGTGAALEERRNLFSALLRIELAVLAAERAAARPDAPPELAPARDKAIARPRKRAQAAGSPQRPRLRMSSAPG